MNKIKNIAIIPARKNSKGIKFKNRKFFKYTSKFIKKLDFIDYTIVSTDDQILVEIAKKENFNIHLRKAKFCRDDISIKKTFLNIIRENNLSKNCNLWLFYLTLPYRRKQDYLSAYKITKKKKFKSLCTFSSIPYKYHPYYAWKISKSGIKNYVKNNVYRRQDLPDSYFHYHYISCIKVSEVKHVNNELININTIPVKINKMILPKLVELDVPQDVLIAKKLGVIN